MLTCQVVAFMRRSNDCSEMVSLYGAFAVRSQGKGSFKSGTLKARDLCMIGSLIPQ